MSLIVQIRSARLTYAFPIQRLSLCMGACVRACVCGTAWYVTQCLHMSSLCDPQILSNAICGQ